MNAFLWIVLPEDMIDSVATQAHDNCVAGHGGVKRNCYNLRKLRFPSFRSCVESITAKGFKAKGFNSKV